jgi:tetratricopeptide (TPR) repeat protein
MGEKDYTGAIALITGRDTPASKKAGKACCSHSLVCLALGNCHLLLKAYGPAETAYQAALKLDPGLMDARLNLAKVYTDTDNYPEAAQAFSLAYDLSDPKTAEYLYYSAVMTLMEGKAGAATRIFETLFAAHPDQIPLQWRESFASALIRAEYWDKAVPVVRNLAARTDGEDRIRWQETLLQVYLTMDDMKQALDWATALARETPGLARWWKALVHIHLSLGNHRRALEDLIIYRFIAPLSREEKTLFADLSLQLQIPARAAAMYETLLAQSSEVKKDSEDKTLILRLVNAYRQLGRAEMALDLLNRFNPGQSHPELLMVKGDLLYEIKQYRTATLTYRRVAHSNFDQKGQAWLMAGYAAWQQNDLEGSRRAFAQAARFKRHRKDALAAIAQLDRKTRM